MGNRGDPLLRMTTMTQTDDPPFTPKTPHRPDFTIEAPHNCGEAQCPGDINRRRLELFERMAAADPMVCEAYTEGRTHPYKWVCATSRRSFRTVEHKRPKHEPDCPWLEAQALRPTP